LVAIVSRSGPALHRLRILIIACAVVINLAAVLRGSSVFTGVWAGTRFALQNRHLTYDEKMALKFPDVFPALRFIAAHSSPQASVLIPPALNQGALTAYLLYPRQVDSHREGFLWGRTPVGTYAYVDGAWPGSLTPDVQTSSRLVAAEDNRFLIQRVKGGPFDGAQVGR
jgi:hypothetical protein